MDKCIQGYTAINENHCCISMFDFDVANSVDIGLTFEDSHYLFCKYHIPLSILLQASEITTQIQVNIEITDIHFIYIIIQSELTLTNADNDWLVHYLLVSEILVTYFQDVDN